MESYKRECWTKADVKCPFYIADDRKKRSISCEGFDADVSTVSRFSTLARRERHMGIYCVENFEGCPVFRCTYDCKYRED